MTITRSISRILTLGIGAVAIAACGGDDNTSVTGGSTSDTTGQASATDPTGGPTTQTSQTSQTTKTTEEPTGGQSGTGDDTSATDTEGATDPATGSATESATEGATGTTNDTDTTGMIIPVCGNGEVEGAEACDDGNQDNGDGCEDNCQPTPECGNGTVEAGEICDDGNTEDGDTCSADCLEMAIEAECGNNTVEDPEVCDDGNLEPGDGCEPDCTPTPIECGNMKVEEGEECDDGNKVNGGPGDFCKNDCTVFVPASCQAPADYVVCDSAINLTDKNDKTNAHKAMGICNDTLANSVQITDYTFQSNNNAAWQVAKGFGSYTYDHDMDAATPNKLLYSPREGDTFLMVSTGVIKAPNAQGVVVENPNSQGSNGGNNNDQANDLPPPFRYEVGSNEGVGGTPFQKCDGVKDCSDTLQEQWLDGNSNPNDKLWFTFKTTVPAGTYGYNFDFVFCSSEWPTYVGTSFNDLLIAYQVDPSADDPMADPPVDPYTGNVTFIPDPVDMTKGLPLTITALDPYLKGPGFSGNEPQLAGTGFETRACSDWFTAKGGVQPGAEVTIGFFIADMSDTILATMAILDNFRWDCEGCIPSEVDDCGIQGPQ